MNIKEKEDSYIINTNNLPDFSAISFVLHVHKENMSRNVHVSSVDFNALDQLLIRYHSPNVQCVILFPKKKKKSFI